MDVTVQKTNLVLPDNPLLPSTCPDFGEERILQTIYEKNTVLNVQMPFSSPVFPKLGSRSLFFNFLDPPLLKQTTKAMAIDL